MHNKQIVALIHGVAEDAEYSAKYYQTHKDWKKRYNAKYYQEHKDYWREYYGTKKSRGFADSLADISNIDLKSVINEYAKKYGAGHAGVSAYGLANDMAGACADRVIAAIRTNLHDIPTFYFRDLDPASDKVAEYLYKEMKRQLGDTDVGRNLDQKKIKKQVYDKLFLAVYDAWVIDDIGVISTDAHEAKPETQKTEVPKQLTITRPKRVLEEVAKDTDPLIIPTQEELSYTSKPIYRRGTGLGGSSIRGEAAVSTKHLTPSYITSRYEQQKAQKAAAEARAKSANRSVQVDPKKVASSSKSVKTSSRLFSKLADAGKNFVNTWKLGFQ